MSAPINIFLSSGESPAATAAEIGSVLGLRFLYVPAREVYEYQGLGFLVTFFAKHGIEDDHGIPFSQYEYEMDIDPRGHSPENPYWRELQIAVGMYAYAELTVRLKYSAIVTDDLQRILARA